MLLRKAIPADGAAIAAIYNQYLGESSMDLEAKTGDYYAAVIADFDPREGIFLLEKEGALQGWGIIKKYSDRLGYRFVCETSVYLDRAYLRQGLGTQIKLALLDQCRAWEYHHIVAKIFATNTASIEYNRRLGYEVVGRQREIGFINGQWVDIVIMQLILN